MTFDELKQVHLYNQHITNKADKQQVCRNLNGVQAQFMVNAEHSLRIRCAEKIEKDSFGGGLLKNWTVRGTVHVFSEDDLPLFIRKRLPVEKLSENEFYQFMCSQGYEITAERNVFFARIIIESIAEGVCERAALKEICKSRGMTEKEEAHVFNQWGGTIRELAEMGLLCFKVKEKKEYTLCPPFTPLCEEDAQLEQTRRYFTNFAPATIRDAAYYFAWSQTKVKQVMSRLPLSQIEIGGKTYFYLCEIKNDYPDVPRCVFLAGFDQLMLGYQKKDSIYLEQKHLRGIFNLAGIVMPPVLLDGNVIGRWRKKNTKMTFEMFKNVPARGKKQIESAMEEVFVDVKKVEWVIL